MANEHNEFVRMFVEIIPDTSDKANDEFEKYIDWLDNNPDIINVKNIERLMGEAYGYHQIRMISMLNNLVRKHNIPTSRDNIVQSAYFSQPIRNERELIDFILERTSKYEELHPRDRVPELNNLLQ